MSEPTQAALVASDCAAVLRVEDDEGTEFWLRCTRTDAPHREQHRALLRWSDDEQGESDV